MTDYNREEHYLISQIAHKALLTPAEFPDLVKRVEDEVGPLDVVDVPEWPGVHYAPLALVMGGGDGMWWEGKSWTGNQFAVPARPYSLERKAATKIAREMAGDRSAPNRLAYQWGCDVYDPDKHIIIRYWCEENDVSVVDFWRKFYPSIEEQAPVIKVTNPRIREEKEIGSYSPTRRAIAAENQRSLDDFLETSNQFSYNLNQSVTWQRSMDDSRWEARRQAAPQSSTWADHRSFINRTIGDGAWTEIDRDPINGYAFGPFMELWDDGTLHVWVYKRALKHLESEPLIINGVTIQLTAEVGRHVWRMVGQVPSHEMAAILNRDEPTETVGSDAILPMTTATVTIWKDRDPFFHAKSLLPASFHRISGSTLVLHKRSKGNQIRVWGDPVLAEGLVLNGQLITGLKPFRGGWRGPVSEAAWQRIFNTEVAEEFIPDPVVESTDITDDLKVYSPSAVKKQLTATLGKAPRFFGRSASDSAIVALSREGMSRFLVINSTDRDQYVLDRGDRNYDCENFAEQLRCSLQTKYGVNGIGVVWGDGHAWNFFVVDGGKDPGIVMVEPQSDEIVTDLKDLYSVDLRCEVIL